MPADTHADDKICLLSLSIANVRKCQVEGEISDDSKDLVTRKYLRSIARVKGEA